ncbi:hypothetical protein X801_08758, partial [Opisthorchis viverrini]
MLALVNFMRQFRHYLIGRKFLVRTDHKSPLWSQNFRDPDGQIVRWQEYLQDIEQKQHGNADALSRRLTRDHGDCPSCSVSYVLPMSLHAPESEEWAAIQSSEPELKLLYQRLFHNQHRPPSDEIVGSSYPTRCLWALWSQLRVTDGVLYYQKGPTYLRRTVVPSSAVETVLKRLHEELGHAGQNKLEESARRRLCWPHMRRDIALFCQSCTERGQVKNRRPSAPAPLQTIKAGFPYELVGVDIIGLLPRLDRGNMHILAMVDHFTKWCEAIPIPKLDAWTVAKTLFPEWIARWGVPYRIHTDQGSNFESLLFKELCHILNIKKTRTTVYHLEGNGM